MKTQTVKSNSDIILSGISADARFVNDQLQEIVLTDTAGNFLIVNSNSYSFQAVVKAKPKTVTKYVLTGEAIGLPVNETFDKQNAAFDRRDELVRYLADKPADLVVTETEVVVED